MGLISLAYECPGCDQIFSDLVKRSERDEGTKCPLCETQCVRDDELITAPNVTRASYVDGRRTDTAKDLIEAAKIESESFNLKPKDWKKHKSEVKRLRTPPSMRGEKK